jgi:zinc protease
MVEALTTPTFPVEQAERLRAQFLTSLAIRAQDTGEMASLTFDQILYAGHPYSRPEDGFVETVQAIRVEDLAAFHKLHYGPRGMVIVVVGAVEPAKVIEQVERALGSWENPAQPIPPDLPQLAPVTTTLRKHIPISGKSQTDLVMGCSGPCRRSPDFIAASLGNNILGQFGMYGRIGDVVRERSGLAYYAYASLNSGTGPGSWEVAAGINPANLEKTIDLVETEIARFIREPVAVDELNDSQANYIGRLPLSLESNNGMANALLNLERFELGLDYYRSYACLVRGVTPTQILSVAQRYLDPQRMVIASAGPDL